MRRLVRLLILRAVSLVGRAPRYRGLPRTAWFLGRYFSREDRAVVTRDMGRLWVYLDDGYWIRLLRRGWEYEPEVAAALSALIKPDSYFIDGGANIGYWSMRTSAQLPRDSVTAIEASSSIHKRLVENAALNDDRWTCLNLALWDVADQELAIHTGDVHHAGSSVVDTYAPVDSVAGTVRTATLDDIMSVHAPDTSRPVIIKLDVEGAEIQALRGAVGVLRDRVAQVIYEDHGRDSTHSVTRFLLVDLGLLIYQMTSGGEFSRVSSIDDLDTIKTNPHTGYNFVATSTPLT